MSQDRLEEMFAPLRERTAPAHLRTRPLAVRHQSFRPVFFVAAGAMGLAAAAVTMWPRPASAAGLLEQAKRAFVGSSVTYVVQRDGKLIRIGQGWYAPGASRAVFADREVASFVHVFNAKAGFEMYWNPAVGNVAWTEGATEDKVNVLPDQLDPKGLAALIREQRLPEDLKLEPGTFEKRPVHRLKFKVGRRTVQLYADTKDLRLVGFEVRYRLPNGTPRHELTVLSPNLPSEKDLAPTISYNGRTFDAGEERKRIAATMVKPLSAETLNGERVSVRKVAMNSRYDLFVLYTGDLHIPSSIRDDAGGTYLRAGGFSPQGHSQAFGSPYRYDGKPLRGAHFIRLGKGRPARVSIAFRKEAMATGGLSVPREYGLDIAKGPLLDFFPFMALAPRTVGDLERAYASTLMFRYYNAKQWPLAERWIRRSNELEVLSEKKNGIQTAWRYLWLAETLDHLGRRREAVLAIREARKRFDPNVEGADVDEDLRKWEKRLKVKSTLSSQGKG
jgi:hypothetical protein